MNRIGRVLTQAWLVAAALVLQALAGLAFAQPYLHPQTQVVFPAEIAGLRNQGIQDYESKQAGLGISVRYQTSKELRADVYVYTAGVPRIPNQIDHPLMKQLRAQTEREILAYAKDKEFEVRKTEGAKVDLLTTKGVVPVLYDAFALTGPDGQQTSYVWLWPARNHFFKVRMTRVSGPHDARQVRDFLETLAGLSAE